MFGYIQPMECELKVREQALYRAAYCGLCRAIGGRYGQAARMALNYDCAFLGLFLETLSEEGVRLEKYLADHYNRSFRTGWMERIPVSYFPS